MLLGDSRIPLSMARRRSAGGFHGLSVAWLDQLRESTGLLAGTMDPLGGVLGEGRTKLEL